MKIPGRETEVPAARERARGSSSRRLSSPPLFGVLDGRQEMRFGRGKRPAGTNRRAIARSAFVNPRRVNRTSRPRAASIHPNELREKNREGDYEEAWDLLIARFRLPKVSREWARNGASRQKPKLAQSTLSFPGALFFSAVYPRESTHTHAHTHTSRGTLDLMTG